MNARQCPVPSKGSRSSHTTQKGVGPDRDIKLLHIVRDPRKLSVAEPVTAI